MAKWIVVTDMANIMHYGNDSPDNTKIDGVANKGTIFDGEEVIEGSWVKGNIGGINGYISRSQVNPFESSSNSSNTGDYSDLDIDYAEIYKMLSGEASSSDTNSVKKALAHTRKGIFGIPYQFMSSVDPRISGTDVGRKYTQKILARSPILFLTPGRPKLMKNSTDQKTAIGQLIDNVKGVSGLGDVSNLLGSTSYYTLEPAHSEFFKHVNYACSAMSYLMDIHNTKVKLYGSGEIKISQIQWQKVMQKAYCTTLLQASQQIPFYLDGLSSVSESLSNDTRESSLVSTLNGVSDSAREIQYLLGSSLNSSKIQEFLGDDGFVSTSTSIEKLLGNNVGGALKTLRGAITNVATGGKIRFPEIWSNSDFSRSYDVNIKLRSPDADPVSLYFNIIVPYLFLFNMAAPQQQADGYTSPFLVRAFYKGAFNIDMGIISSMSISKGDEMCWNDQGIPTKMDISLTIKDMYNSIPTGVSTGANEFVQNTALMDYLCNLAGVNITQNVIGRKLGVWRVLVGNQTIRGVLGNLQMDISDKISRNAFVDVAASLGKIFQS